MSGEHENLEPTVRLDLGDMMASVKRAKAEREAWDADVAAMLAKLDTWVLDELARLLMLERARRSEWVLTLPGRSGITGG